MKHLMTLCGAAALALTMAGPASAVVIFQDDFTRADSATVGNGWVETGAAISNNQLLMTASGTTVTQGTATLSTLGLVNIDLSFDWLKSANQGSTADELQVLWSPTGTTFTLLTTVPLTTVSTTFTSVSLLLVGAENLADISIRFALASGQPGDAARIDNVSLKGIPAAPVPEPSTLGLIGLGLLGLSAMKRRRRRHVLLRKPDGHTRGRQIQRHHTVALRLIHQGRLPQGALNSCAASVRRATVASADSW